jgi:hypothetical protein
MARMLGHGQLTPGESAGAVRRVTLRRRLSAVNEPAARRQVVESRIERADPDRVRILGGIKCIVPCEQPSEFATNDFLGNHKARVERAR